MPSGSREWAPQQAAYDDAIDALRGALADLAYEAKQAGRAARRGTGTAALLADTHAAYRAVLAAEQAVDITEHDLDGAKGADL